MKQSTHVKEKISDYVLDLVSENEKRDIAWHLTGCRECQQAINQERQISLAVRDALTQATQPDWQRLQDLMPPFPKEETASLFGLNWQPGFALVGLLAIAYTSIRDLPLKSFAVPFFHGVAGLIIFILPFVIYAKENKSGFWLVGVGGALIGIGGIALAFEIAKKPLFVIFTEDFIHLILAPLLFLMTLAFTYGFRKDIGSV